MGGQPFEAYRLEVRIVLLMADLAKKLVEPQKLQWEQSYTMTDVGNIPHLQCNQHRQKQDSNDTRRKHMGQRPDETKQLK